MRALWGVPRCTACPLRGSLSLSGALPSGECSFLAGEPREPPTKRSSAPAAVRTRLEETGEGQGKGGKYTTLFPATLPPQVGVGVQGWVSPAGRGAGASWGVRRVGWEVRRVGRKWCCYFTPRPRPDLASSAPSRSEPAGALRLAYGAGPDPFPALVAPRRTAPCTPARRRPYGAASRLPSGHERPASCNGPPVV